ncbi:MAG: hypothetical protein REI09_01270 [Candidatus Dactylopiibacterium sp.]|nr:hypothetical protein [Candidatus Dactylopiibacterium sp.]
MPQQPLSVAPDHPALAGHFPGHPIVPGVVLLDAAQALVEAALGTAVSGIALAKFTSPAAPGDALALDFAAHNGGVRFEISCGTRKIASGRFTLAGA